MSAPSNRDWEVSDEKTLPRNRRILGFAKAILVPVGKAGLVRDMWDGWRGRSREVSQTSLWLIVIHITLYSLLGLHRNPVHSKGGLDFSEFRPQNLNPTFSRAFGEDILPLPLTVYFQYTNSQ